MTANDNKRMTPCQMLDRLAMVLDRVILRDEDRRRLEQLYAEMISERRAA